MKKLITVTALSGFIAFAVSPAWACSMAGPNTHIGVVTDVNASANTFTMMDAETQHPITFVATPELLKGLSKSQQVTVTFHKTGKNLTAKTIQL